MCLRLPTHCSPQDSRQELAYQAEGLGQRLLATKKPGLKQGQQAKADQRPETKLRIKLETGVRAGLTSVPMEG